MNTSIFVVSFRYISNKFNLVTSLAFWIYQELMILKYTDEKLSKAFRIMHDFEIAESIIHLNINKHILNKLLLEALDESRIDDFYRRTKLLLEHGATDVHMKDELILRKACRLGYSSLVKIILKYKPDVNTHFGYCIFKAFDNNDSEIAELLLEAGARLDLINNNEVIKRTYSYGRSKLIKLLVKYGSDMYVNDNKLIENDIIDFESL